jgi:hypothetical protein
MGSDFVAKREYGRAIGSFFTKKNAIARYAEAKRKRIGR